MGLGQPVSGETGLQGYTPTITQAGNSFGTPGGRTAMLGPGLVYVHVQFQATSTITANMTITCMGIGPQSTPLILWDVTSVTTPTIAGYLTSGNSGGNGVLNGTSIALTAAHIYHVSGIFPLI